MANLIASAAMSHAPQLMLNPDYWHLLNNRQRENLPDKPGLEKETQEVKWAKWNDCMAAIAKLCDTITAARPDVIIVVGDDQHENLVDDNMPPFSIYMGADAEASVSLRYLNQPKSENRTKYRIDAKMAKALIDGLMDEGFDPAYSKKTRYDGGLGHAFARVLKFLSPDANHPVIPVMVNTYYPPAPSAKRCAAFGQALARVLRRVPGGERVVIVASGGLSHTKIDEKLDHDFIQALESNDLNYMAAMPADSLVEGTSEIRNWIVTAAAADRAGKMIDYQPLYRTTTGVGCAMGFAHWDLSQ
jgi:aromatic ring-opening dioxygenase catalytic subunit (LigB family)